MLKKLSIYLLVFPLFILSLFLLGNFSNDLKISTKVEAANATAQYSYTQYQNCNIPGGSTLALRLDSEPANGDSSGNITFTIINNPPAGMSCTITVFNKNGGFNCNLSPQGAGGYNGSQFSVFYRGETGNSGPGYCTNQIGFLGPVAAPAPTCTLSASPTSIVQGNSATLSFNSTNATSFSISGGVGTVTPLNAFGQKNVSPTTTTTYTGTVTNSAGVQATCPSPPTVTVTLPPAPTCTLTFVPNTVTAGSQTTLSWTNSGSATPPFVIDQAGQFGIGNSQMTFVPPASGLYTGTITGPGGSNTCSAYITVNPVPQPAPTCNLTFTPSSVTWGYGTNATWSSTNATSGSFNPSLGNGQPSGSVNPFYVLTSTTYYGTFTGPGGTGYCPPSAVWVYPQPPSNPTVTASCNGTTPRNTVQWSAAYGATSYYISRTDGGIGTAWGGTTYIDENTTNNGSYTYNIYAVNATGQSAPVSISKQANNCTPTPPPVQAPFLSAITSCSGPYPVNDIYWSPVDGNTYNNIYIFAADGSYAGLIGPATTWRDWGPANGLTTNRTYGYYVYAHATAYGSATGNPPGSGWSPAAYISVTTPNCAPPTLYYSGSSCKPDKTPQISIGIDIPDSANHPNNSTRTIWIDRNGQYADFKTNFTNPSVWTDPTLAANNTTYTYKIYAYDAASGPDQSLSGRYPAAGLGVGWSPPLIVQVKTPNCVPPVTWKASVPSGNYPINYVGWTLTAGTDEVYYVRAGSTPQFVGTANSSRIDWYPNNNEFYTYIVSFHNANNGPDQSGGLGPGWSPPTLVNVQTINVTPPSLVMIGNAPTPTIPTISLRSQIPPNPFIADRSSVRINILNIEQSTNGGNSWVVASSETRDNASKLLATAGPNNNSSGAIVQTSYANMACNTTYSYRARTYVSATDDWSNYSPVVSVYVDACPQPQVTLSAKQTGSGGAFQTGTATIAAGSKPTIQWVLTNATECQKSTDKAGSTWGTANYSTFTQPLTQPTTTGTMDLNETLAAGETVTYYLQCRNNWYGYDVASRQITVKTDQGFIQTRGGDVHTNETITTPGGN